MAVLPLNGYIYAAGGSYDLDVFAKTYRYDPGTNTWDDGPIADLPGGETLVASGFYNNRWVLAPASVGVASASAIAWDPATNIWASVDQMLNATLEPGAAVVAGAFYVVGGKDPGYTPGNSVQKYLETPCAPPSPTPPPGATPTICPIQFSDVPQDSTFYPFIHCLACLGIINGYADGTFKPNNAVTRGQLSKIVSNAAGFEDPQPVQMFQDVPLGSTFQAFIGRLVSRGYINGYPCGGAGEPCEPGNLPYFRPNNNSTRGQISKIVSNAAGFSDTPTGQQFEDVRAGSTYFTYTFRLVSRSIMGGYPCGGARRALPAWKSAILQTQQ